MQMVTKIRHRRSEVVAHPLEIISTLPFQFQSQGLGTVVEDTDGGFRAVDQFIVFVDVIEFGMPAWKARESRPLQPSDNVHAVDCAVDLVPGGEGFVRSGGGVLSSYQHSYV